MFTFNTASPAAFVTACEAKGQPYALLRAGQRLTLRRVDDQRGVR